MQVVHGNFHHAAAQLSVLIFEGKLWDVSDEYILERSQFLYYFSESVMQNRFLDLANSPVIGYVMMSNAKWP